MLDANRIQQNGKEKRCFETLSLLQMNTTGLPVYRGIFSTRCIRNAMSFTSPNSTFFRKIQDLYRCFSSYRCSCLRVSFSLLLRNRGNCIFGSIERSACPTTISKCYIPSNDAKTGCFLLEFSWNIRTRSVELFITNALVMVSFSLSYFHQHKYIANPQNTVRTMKSINQIN